MKFEKENISSKNDIESINFQIQKLQQDQRDM